MVGCQAPEVKVTSPVPNLSSKSFSPVYARAGALLLFKKHSGQAEVFLLLSLTMRKSEEVTPMEDLIRGLLGHSAHILGTRVPQVVLDEATEVAQLALAEGRSFDVATEAARLVLQRERQALAA